MKKILLMMLLLAGSVQLLPAIPAMPGKFTRTLPDGRKVILQLHGDEFRHWMTDASGQVVKEDGRGFIVPSSLAEVPVRMGGAQAVNRMRTARLDRTRQLLRPGGAAKAPAQALHFPMILVQFPDRPFKIASTDELVWEAFNNLANQAGYSTGGATGSIHDYYVDNSMGQTEFYFDVYGPVTVSRSYSYYGSDKPSPDGQYKGEPAAEALMEAVRLVAADKGPGVFNPYDNDGDGYVDAVFMYYAGYNQAEGGPADTIWPHEWTVDSWDYIYGTAYATEVFGNVRFGVYSCASELRGNSGTSLCGIGTAVHEFGHALGLPDLYDTNGDDYGDGNCGGLYTYSPMCSGSYNNNSRTPSCFTMEERIMMGWADGFEPMPAFGTITIPPVSTNFAYREDTDVEGEYFVFECRSGLGWDSAVDPGLVVYHVDKSSNELVLSTGPDDSFTTTAGQVWKYYSQNINTSASHPCYYVIPAVDQSSVNYYGSYSGIPFPASGMVTTYRWQGWASENRQGDRFYDISFSNKTRTVTMKREGVDTGIEGWVRLRDGSALEGAVVKVYREYLPEGVTLPSPRSGGAARIVRHMGEPVVTVETGPDGRYLAGLQETGISGTVTVEVSAPGFLSQTRHVAIRERDLVKQNFTLRTAGEPVTGSILSKSQDQSSLFLLGFGGDETMLQMAAIRYSAEDLVPYEGCRIVSLGFMYNLSEESTCSAVKGVIDFGSERRLVMDVPSPEPGAWNFLDVSGEDLRIPQGEDCSFVSAVVDCNDGFPFYCSEEDPVDGGLLLYVVEDTTMPEYSYWWDYSDQMGPLVISVILEGGTVLTFNYISDPGKGTYGLGSTLDLDLVRVAGDRAPGTEISWYYDDEPVSGTVTFTRPGKHLLEARFTTAAGRRKVVELEVEVEK